MVEAFPGFARLMLHADWKEAVRTAVYWYVRADTNHVGPDGAIILLQAALERLAWHISSSAAPRNFRGQFFEEAPCRRPVKTPVGCVFDSIGITC